MVFYASDNKTLMVIKKYLKEDEDEFAHNIRVLEEWFEKSEHLHKKYGMYSMVKYISLIAQK